MRSEAFDQAHEPRQANAGEVVALDDGLARLFAQGAVAAPYGGYRLSGRFSDTQALAQTVADALADMGAIELNEAFALQMPVCIRTPKLDLEIGVKGISMQ